MFEIRVVDGVVRLKGRLDASQSDQALKVMRGIEGPISVDCSELDYISSAGIGVIIETYRRLHGSGHTLKLVNLLPRVRNIFAYAGLDRILTIE